MKCVAWDRAVAKCGRIDPHYLVDFCVLGDRFVDAKFEFPFGDPHGTLQKSVRWTKQVPAPFTEPISLTVAL